MQKYKIWNSRNVFFKSFWLTIRHTKFCKKNKLTSSDRMRDTRILQSENHFGFYFDFFKEDFVSPEEICCENGPFSVLPSIWTKSCPLPFFKKFLNFFCALWKLTLYWLYVVNNNTEIFCSLWHQESLNKDLSQNLLKYRKVLWKRFLSQFLLLQDCWWN